MLLNVVCIAGRKSAQKNWPILYMKHQRQLPLLTAPPYSLPPISPPSTNNSEELIKLQFYCPVLYSALCALYDRDTKAIPHFRQKVSTLFFIHPVLALSWLCPVSPEFMPACSHQLCSDHINLYLVNSLPLMSQSVVNCWK